MAQNVTIAGASYTGVPSINVPKTGGGTASFVDEDLAYKPIEISSDAGMTAVLISANIGKVYKFTGTTGTYTNGDLYIVISFSGQYIFQHFKEIINVATATVKPSSSTKTISFTVSGQPTHFFVRSSSGNINTSSSSTYYTSSVLFDGSTISSTAIRKQYYYCYTSGNSTSYSNNTFTVTANQNFKSNVTYTLIYIYS